MKGFETLIKPGPQYETGQLVSERDLTGPTGSTRVWVDDVNGDGKLDILIGDCITLVSMAKGVTKQQYDQKLAKWKQAVDSASAAMSEAGPGGQGEGAEERFREVYRQRTEFMHEERTGYVWLYRRK